MKKLIFIMLLLASIFIILFIGHYVWQGPGNPPESPIKIQDQNISEETSVVEPSPTSPWVESEVGPVYAQETHYVKPSPDGKYLYAYSMDTRNIIVLDLENRTIVQDIKMPGFWAQASNMIFSSDGRWMYTLNAAQVGDRRVVVIDTKTQEIDHLILLPKEYEPDWANIAISPDEQFLYVSSVPGFYRVNIDSEQVAKISNIGMFAFLAFTPSGEYLLGANMATNSLDIINPSNGKLIDSIPVGGSPQYILVSPDGQMVYVSNWESGDVSVVDLGTRKVIANIPVGVNPLGMTITPDGSKLYVAVTAQALEHVKDKPPEKVVVINTTTYAVIKETKLGVMAPRYLSISPDGTKVYVGEYTRNGVRVLNTSSDEVIDFIPLTRPAAYLPGNIALTPDGSKLFVYANGAHQFLVIDAATHALLARFNAFSEAIAVSPDGRRAYVPGFQSAVIDIPSLSVKYIETPYLDGSLKIVLSKDSRTAYVADTYNDVLQVVDLADWRLTASIPVGDMGSGESSLAITPDGSKVFVCNGRSKDISVVSTTENKVTDTIPMESALTGMAFSPDGRIAYVIEIQSDVWGFTDVVAIDVATHKVIQRWAQEPIGFGNPFEVAVSPDGQHAYFGGVDGEIAIVMDIVNGTTRYIDVGLDPFNIALSKDGRLLYVSNTNSDDITVIDTQTERVVDRIPIQLNGTGFIYATLTDSRGKQVSVDVPLVRFAPYDQGVRGNFTTFGLASQHPRLEGYWIPVPEGDYMLWVSANNEDQRFVSQIYNGISDFESRAKATRVRVKEGQITSVNFVLLEGHQVSGILVDQDGNPVSAGGNIVNTQTRASIGGCIGFGSDKDGRFLVNVPDGVYDLSFGGIGVVASGIPVYADVDLGKVFISGGYPRQQGDITHTEKIIDYSGSAEKPEKKLTFIDTHAHFFSGGDAVQNADRLVEEMDKANVSKAVLFGGCDQPYFNKNLYVDGIRKDADERVLEAYKKYPDRFYPMLSGFDPQNQNSVEYLEQQLATGFWKGLGEIYMIQFSMLNYKTVADHPNMMKIYRVLARYNVPIFFHYERRSKEDVDAMYRALEQNPDVKFVWVHFGSSGLLKEVENELVKYPNLYFLWEVPISKGMKENKDFLNLLEKYPNRFMIGSDVGCTENFTAPTDCPNPPECLTSLYGDAIAIHRELLSKLSPETAKKIAYKNLEILMGGSPEEQVLGERGQEGPLQMYNQNISGEIRQSQIWSGNIHVTGDVWAVPEATITILPGTNVYIAAGRDDQNGGMGGPVDEREDPIETEEYAKTHIGIHARIVAKGLPDQKILFTSDAPEKTFADWACISLNEGSTIDNAIVEYGGNCGLDSTVCGECKNVTISNSTIRHVLWGCVTLGGSSATVINNEIYDCGHEGVDTQPGGGTPVIKNNVIKYSANGLMLNENSFPLVENNTIIDNSIGIAARGCGGRIVNNYISSPNGPPNDWVYKNYVYRRDSPRSHTNSCPNPGPNLGCPGTEPRTGIITIPATTAEFVNNTIENVEEEIRREG